MSKKKSALRIMEALSGADQELLERCDISEVNDQKNVRKKVGNRILSLPVFWKRTAAACVALIVVGTLSWNGLRLIYGPAGFDSSVENSAGGSGYTGGTAELGQVTDSAEPQATDSAAPQAMESNTGDLSGTESYDEEGTVETENQKFVEQMVRSEKSDSEICVDYADPSVKLTEQEARGEEVFGAYIPENIPNGYTFESARSSADGLNVTWIRGMDYIMIFLSAAQEENLKTIDVEKTETYDERLYEIPYGETVPAEYREVFNDPLFAAEDLSLEVVSSRMKSVADAGDTDTPRGNFSVLFPDGVVLRFNGRGTAEEIWNMIESVMR